MTSYLIAFFNAANDNVAQMTEQTLAHEMGAANAVSQNDELTGTDWKFSVPVSAQSYFSKASKVTLSEIMDVTAEDAKKHASSNTMRIVEMVAQQANTEFSNVTRTGQTGVEQENGIVQTDTSETAQVSNLIASFLSGLANPPTVS